MPLIDYPTREQLIGKLYIYIYIVYIYINQYIYIYTIRKTYIIVIAALILMRSVTHYSIGTHS